MRIVNDETGEEWDNEIKEYPIVEINGKKYRDTTADAMESSGCYRGNMFGKLGGDHVIDPNTRFRIGSKWKRSKRIKFRKVL